MLNRLQTRPRLTTMLRAICGALLLQGAGAHAMNLQQAYDAALHNDPAYREAYQDSLAGAEYKALGRSGLLPQLSASYSANKIRADLTAPNVFGQITTTHPVYYSHADALQLRQVLFSLDALARYKQGVAQSQYAASQFSSAGQELVVRLAGTYFDAALSAEQVALARAQRDAQQEQYRTNERLFAKGEGTRTDMLETQARLQLSEAQLIESLDNQQSSMAALVSIVGEAVPSVEMLGDSFHVQPLQPATLADWKELALAHNPDLQAQRYAIEASVQEVNKNRAGHTPRIDLVSSLSKTKSDTLTTLNQDATSRSIGVQINIPLYSGGAVSASTRQAAAGLEKARAELDLRTAKVMVEVGKQYGLVNSGMARIAALDRAVESAQLLVKATEQSIKGGVRINLDLLNAQQQLYTSKRDLAQARYTYLQSLLRLRAAAGTLGADDVRDAASYFH